MGCVYYRWQLVFTDLINNHKRHILYFYWFNVCDLLCSLDACMLYWTPNDTYDSIEHLILLLTALITVYLCFVCDFSLIPIYINIMCWHVICTWTFFLFYTLIRSLSDDPGFVTSRLDILFFWSGVNELVYFARSLELPSARSSVFLRSFIPLIPFSLYISLTYHPIPFLCSLLSCADIMCIIAVMLILHSRFL